MKKKLLILLILMLFIPFAVNAYEVKIEWKKNWGGSDKDGFEGVNILQTQDGGFILLSNTKSTDIEDLTNNGQTDAIIVKYDKDGNVLWQKNWGGNDFDLFNNIFQTSDDGFIVFGGSMSTDIEGLPNKGSYDVIIVKYDKDGNLLWQKNWGGNGSDSFMNFVQTEDDCFIAFVSSWSTDIERLPNKGMNDVIIVKYDKDGNLLWQKSWGGNSYDDFHGFIQIEDGGFIAYGKSESTDIEGLPNKGFWDAIIVKYDKDGNMLWQKSWGGRYSEAFNDILLTQDDEYIAIGFSQSEDIEGLPNKGGNDAIIVKYDKDGNMLWQKSWGGDWTDEFENIFQTSDGEIIAYGFSSSSDIEGLPCKGGEDAIIVKYDKDGNILLQARWGGNYGEKFYDILQTQDGSFVATGYSGSKDIEGLVYEGYYSDAITVVFDRSFNVVWQEMLGGSGSAAANNYLIFNTLDGGFITIGTVRKAENVDLEILGDQDIMIIKYNFEYELENTTTENGTSTVEQQGANGIITPTPNKGYEVDKIIIKDKEGNVLDIEVVKLEDGTYSFELYTDVSVEVIYKEKIENPKTGILDVITIIFVGLFISLSGFVFVKRYNERLEF